MHHPDDFHPISTVDQATSERGEIVLRRRTARNGADVLELRVNGVFVMDTEQTSAERALASEALALSGDPRRVLVGGLGLGFTTRALLTDPRVRQVDVVEIEEALIAWTRAGTVPDDGMLSDDRLRLVRADVSDVIRRVDQPSYDLILLDVDNGPGYLVYDDNAAIYRGPFLRRVHDALRPGGVAVVWSSAAEPGLLATMRTMFDDVEERTVDVRLGERAEQYFLYLGRSRIRAECPSM